MPPENNEPHGTPRQVARRSRTDEKITAAVLALIRRDGLSAVTIDAVAAESGVAKTTIYRRYDDRLEMLNGVAQFLASPPAREYPRTQAGLCELLADIREIFETHIGFAAVGGLLANRRSALDEWRGRIVDPTLETLRTFFNRGVAEGVFSPDVDYEQIIELVIGGLVVSDALRGGVPGDWSPDLVGLLWPAISPGTPTPGRS